MVKFIATIFKTIFAKTLWTSSFVLFCQLFTLSFYFISEVTHSNIINNLGLSRFPLPSSFKDLEAFLSEEQYNIARHSAAAETQTHCAQHYRVLIFLLFIAVLHWDIHVCLRGIASTLKMSIGHKSVHVHNSATI